MTTAGMGEAEGQLGQALARSSAFFVDFDLIEYEPAKAIGDGQIWHGYRPADPRLQQSVTLNLEIDRLGAVERLTLCLDRAGLAHPVTGPLLRGMSCDFLRWALPSGDRAALADLMTEIAGGAKLHRSDLQPFPSSGYRTFLGHQGESEHSLAASHLRIVNLNWRRRPDDVVTPPGYDGETMWLWLIVRRLS